MTDAAAQKPVFIDQTPDYQEALRQIAAMPPEKIPGVVTELRLTPEMEKRNAEWDSINASAQPLSEKMADIAGRMNSVRAKWSAVNKHNAANSGLAGLGGGIAVGAVVAKKAGGAKGALAGIATGITAATALFYGSTKSNNTRASQKLASIEQDYEHVQAQAQEIDRRLEDTSRRFVAAMATRMLEEQKMLVGQGADMKLVSTRQPRALTDARPAGMAQKYAAAPAASRVEAVTQPCGCTHHRG